MVGRVVIMPDLVKVPDLPVKWFQNTVWFLTKNCGNYTENKKFFLLWKPCTCLTNHFHKFKCNNI